MEQLTDASRQVSATAQQIAAAAGNLNDLAGNLEYAGTRSELAERQRQRQRQRQSPRGSRDHHRYLTRISSRLSVSMWRNAGRKLGRRHGSGPQEPLTEVAALVPEQLGLGDGFDTFGDDADVERVGEVDDAGHDRVVLRVQAEPGDEGAIDLQEVDRIAPQVEQRRVPGAEVVDIESDTEVAQRGEDLARALRVLHDGRLGDLESECAWVETGLVECLADAVTRSGWAISLADRLTDTLRGAILLAGAIRQPAGTRRAAPMRRAGRSGRSPRPAG